MFGNLRRTVSGTILGAAAALFAAQDLAEAREIEVDDVTIAAGTREGRASQVPWSGVWWPFVDTELAKGWNGTSDDFTYDATAKRWNRAGAQKPVNDRSPLLKYDEYIRLSTGTDPQSALLECTGDDAQDFEHSVYGDKKEQYDRDGVSYSWWGHCNGWAGAACMEQEPIAPIEARGIKFDVADLKGLLSESFWGVESDFSGKRYNKPPQYITESRQPGKDLLAALNSQNPKPVADYIAWYEKAYKTTMSAAAKAAAKPADFKDELENFESWFVRSYDEAYKDLAPGVFHKILETTIGRKRLALVFDVTANEEVWNHPAFKYSTQVTHARDFTESGVQLKEWTVATTVWYATDGVSESILGISDFTKNYTYKLVTDAAGKVRRSEWTGSSVDNHPDFAWVPTFNPAGVDYGENYKLLYGKIQEILPVAHRSTDARAIALSANGTSAASRRGERETTTWDNPVTASGDVQLSAAVASGRAVARVKYFEEPVSGYSDITASRAALAALGESTTGPAFASTARFASAGKKLVVAYAYDAAGRLLGVDEIALQYSVSGGGGGGTTTADDAFEQNDSKVAASLVAAGTFSNLYCGDDDWYKVVLAQTGSITVRLDFQHSEGDVDTTLEGPAGQIAKSDSSSNQETLSGASLAAGTYHVRVYGYNGAKAKYAMTVTTTQTQGGGGTTTTDDSFEENDTKAAAKPVAAGSFPGLKCQDDDWFKVTLAQPGSLTVKIDFRNAEGDLDLILQNASGADLAKSESTADSEQVSKTGLAAGDYFVRVFGYSGARAAYSLTVSTTQSQGGGTTTRTGTVTASALNVRSGPGSTYAVVTVVRSGQVLTILGESGSYYRVTWTGAPTSTPNLYVYKSYVRVN